MSNRAGPWAVSVVGRWTKELRVYHILNLEAADICPSKLDIQVGQLQHDTDQDHGVRPPHIQRSS